MINMVSNSFINSRLKGYLSKDMSSHSAEEVKIRLKHGEWEVEVVCIESRVKQVVESVLSSLDTVKMIEPEVQNQIDALRREIDSLKARPIAELGLEGQQQQQQKMITKSGITCRGLLENLWFEGHFISEKSLGEVHEELSRRGYNYDRTAVSHSLTDMVRENILTRIGTMRNYRYIQKRPPNDTTAQA
jgi:BMFP domain-containing protein YqiC